MGTCMYELLFFGHEASFSPGRLFLLCLIHIIQEYLMMVYAHLKMEGKARKWIE